MRTLTPDEFTALEVRNQPAARVCTEQCAELYANWSSYSHLPCSAPSILAPLRDRGLLTSFQCQHSPGVHWFTSPDGVVAMTLYKLILSLSDLKLQGNGQ